MLVSLDLAVIELLGSCGAILFFLMLNVFLHCVLSIFVWRNCRYVLSLPPIAAGSVYASRDADGACVFRWPLLPLGLMVQWLTKVVLPTDWLLGLFLQSLLMDVCLWVSMIQLSTS